ncbi:PerC family transcriptional regulator [Klebsiella aerogenes]
MVHDTIAESLEISGLWRRAAARWLDVLMQCQTEEQRDWVRKRRNFCLSNTRRTASAKLDAVGMTCSPDA